MSHTIKNLRDVEDSAAGSGLEAIQEARFASEGLEYIAFGPLHKGDGEPIKDFWE